MTLGLVKGGIGRACAGALSWPLRRPHLPRQPDGERLHKIPMGGAGRLAGARRRPLRRPGPGPTGVGAAIFQPRQPAPRHLHRQLPRRTRPARGQTREHRSSRRRSDRVCRRARTRGRRLHQIHLSRSAARPELIVTIGGPAAVFARKYRRQLFPDTPLLFASVDRAISSRRAASARTRPPSRSTSIFPDSSTTSCSCFPRPGRCSW